MANRSNLIAAGDDFSNVAWTVKGTVSGENSISDNNDLEVGEQQYGVEQSIDAEPGAVIVARATCKAGTLSWVMLWLGVGVDYTDASVAWFNLSSGAVGSCHNCTAQIMHVTDGFFECTIRGMAKSQYPENDPKIGVYLTTADKATGYPGNGKGTVQLSNIQAYHDEV